MSAIQSRLRSFLAAGTAAALCLSIAAPASAGGDVCRIGGQPVKLTVNPSVIVNDQTVLTDDNFGFARTIGQILSSQGGQDTPANREAFLQTMLDTFNVTQQSNALSGLAMPVDQRPNEAGLDPAALLDANDPAGLHPIGVFNRLDLAPADFSNCGEHRVVYTTRQGSPIDRFFLIFEARVANPAGTGFDGCRPIADFWASLSGKPKTEQAQELERFYYEGLGNGIGPVIQARNYGQPDGQVRGNVFVGFTKWQLREWVVANAGPAGGTFLATTVKTNPLTEFYADASGPGSPDAALEETERTDFMGRLQSTYAKELITIDATGPAVGVGDPGGLQAFKQALFAGLATNIDGRFDEFQSDSQGVDDDPLTMAPSGGRARTALDAGLAANPLSNGREVVSGQALVRLGALSCGGCHEFSNGGEIGTVNGEPIFWPSSAGFVHIDQDSSISEALRDWFLPARLENLKEAACEGDDGIGYPGGADGMTQETPAAAPETMAASEAPGAPGAAGADGNPRFDAVDQAAARLRETPAAAPESLGTDRSAAPAQAEGLTQYLDTVETLREEEREKPGAFVPIRRVH